VFPELIVLPEGGPVKADSTRGSTTVTFGPDGQGTVEIGIHLIGVRAVDRARVEQDWVGVDSFRYTADHQMITILSGGIDEATVVTRIDGRQVDKQPVPLTLSSTTYTCSPTHLILTSEGIELDRA